MPAEIGPTRKPKFVSVFGFFQRLANQAIDYYTLVAVVVGAISGLVILSMIWR